MKQWINGLIFLVSLVWHAVPIVWRHNRGGFFCFRDAPTWVVQEFSEMNPEELGPDLKGLHPQALDELTLRNRKD